jgi:hypothetical protein
MDVLKIILGIGAPLVWALCGVAAWRMWRDFWWRKFGEDMPHPRREFVIHITGGLCALLGTWLAVRMHGKGHGK